MHACKADLSQRRARAAIGREPSLELETSDRSGSLLFEVDNARDQLHKASWGPLRLISSPSSSAPARPTCTSDAVRRMREVAEARRAVSGRASLCIQRVYRGHQGRAEVR